MLKHDKGLCHLYVDDGADLDMALAVAVNAKAQRVSVCNSLETLLVHAAIAPALLPRLAARLAEVPVEVRADGRASYAIVAQVMAAISASGFSDINLITDTGGPSSGPKAPVTSARLDEAAP